MENRHRKPRLRCRVCDCDCFAIRRAAAHMPTQPSPPAASASDRPRRMSNSPHASVNRPSAPAAAEPASPPARRRLQNPTDLNRATPWNQEPANAADQPPAASPSNGGRRRSPRQPAAAPEAALVPSQSSSRASTIQNANWDVDGGMFYLLLAQFMLRDLPPSVSPRNW